MQSHKDYKFAVYIGRFQPFHNEHWKVLENALTIADEVLMLIGSYKVARNTRNPWTYEERVEMIKTVLGQDIRVTQTSNTEFTTTTGGADLRRVHFQPLRDHYYSDSLWCAEVQQKTSQFIQPGDSVALVGAYKDATSYYLNMFPQWEFVGTKKAMLSSTDVREKMFDDQLGTGRHNEYNPYQYKPELYAGTDSSFEKDLPVPVVSWLKTNFYGKSQYHDCVVESNFLRDYKDKTKFVGVNFPPTFVTVDAVVVKSGHILMVKRKFSPGKGLWALPGGFLKESELIEDAMLRELREETAIDAAKPILRSNIKESKVFDYPQRSLRGRTITHAFFINLGHGELPQIRANDDAAEARWLSLADFFQYEDKMFEDHSSVVQYFMTRA